jgi:hypothetical protein
MAVFELGGKTIQVDPHRTWWPLSVFYKRQGVSVQVDPETHWWCAWLCSTTDDVDMIECPILLKSALVPDVEANGSCTDCGDLTVDGPASYGFSGPWPYDSVEFKGTVRIDGSGYGFSGVLVYS